MALQAYACIPRLADLRYVAKVISARAVAALAADRGNRDYRRVLRIHLVDNSRVLERDFVIPSGQGVTLSPRCIPAGLVRKVTEVAIVGGRLPAGGMALSTSSCVGAG